MFENLYIVASVGYLIWSIRNVFFWVNLLREQGYSLRNILSYLGSTSSGRGIVFSPFSFFKWLAIFVYPLIIFYEAQIPVYYWFVTTLYVLEVVIVIRECFTRELFRNSRLTLKTSVLFLLTIGCMIGLYLLPPVDIFLWLLLLDRIMVILLAVVVLLYSLPEEFYWDYRAVKLLSMRKSGSTPQVILLVGGGEVSYVATSLKNALQEHANVALCLDVTDKRQLIDSLTKSDTDTTYLIIVLRPSSSALFAEQLTVLAPKYCLVTDIPGFVLQESTRNRFEKFTTLLYDSLPSDGLLLLDRQEAEWKTLRLKKKKIHWFGTSVGEILLKKDKTLVKQSPGTLPLELSSVTELAARYFEPALTLARILGSSATTLKQAAREETGTRGYLSYLVVHGISVVDVSAEENIKRVLSLCSYAKLFKKKRVLVLDSSGKRHISHDEYLRIGKQLAGSFTYVFLLDVSSARLIKKGLSSSRQVPYVTTLAVNQVRSVLTQLLEKDDLVVFFGSETRDVARKFS